MTSYPSLLFTQFVRKLDNASKILIISDAKKDYLHQLQPFINELVFCDVSVHLFISYAQSFKQSFADMDNINCNCSVVAFKKILSYLIYEDDEMSQDPSVNAGQGVKRRVPLISPGSLLSESFDTCIIYDHSDAETISQFYAGKIEDILIIERNASPRLLASMANLSLNSSSSIHVVSNLSNNQSSSISYIPSKTKQIAVVLPTYNVGNLLHECCSTVRKSLKGSGNIYIVDDGSTDIETLNCIEKEIKSDDCKLIRKLNGGCASARNLGIKMTDEPYISLIDPDDFVSEDFFDCLIDGVSSGRNISEVQFSDYIQTTGDILPHSDFVSQSHPDGQVSFFCSNPWFYLRRQPTIWRRLYRRKFLKENSLWFPEHIRAYDDMEFQFLSLLLNQGVSSSLQGTYFYRKDRPGQDVAASDSRHLATYSMISRISQFINLNCMDNPDYITIFDQFKVDCLGWSYVTLRDDLKPLHLYLARHCLLPLNASRERIEHTKSYLQSLPEIYNHFAGEILNSNPSTIISDADFIDFKYLGPFLQSLDC